MTTSTHAALAVATTPAERLAAIMRKGEGQRAFAGRIGIDQAQVSKLLNGKKADLDLDTWRTIAANTGLPLALLIGADEPPRPTGPGLRDIPWIMIHPSPLNPRKSFDPEAIAELADSIAASGILQNLIVRPKSGVPDDDTGGYWLIGGERRWRAVQHLIETGRAGMQHPMPCKVIVCDDDQHLRHAIVENLQRQDVPAIEEAEAFAALRKAGWGTDRIAEETGKTRRFVQLRLTLTDKLIPEAQELLRAGKINGEQARALATGEPKKQKDVVKSYGGTGLPKSEDIRSRLRGYDGVHASKCRFDLDRYTGPRYEDDTGNVWLQDKKIVTALQMEWAKGEAARIRDSGEAAWAAAHQGWISENSIRRTDDPTKAGTLIRVTYDASIEISTGVDLEWWLAQQVEKRNDEEAAKARNEAWERRREDDRARQAKINAVSHAMVQALLDADEATRTRLAVALTLYGLHASYDDPLVPLVKDTGAMRALVGRTTIDDDGDIVRGSRELVLRALLRAPLERLQETLTDVVAHAVISVGRYDNWLAPHVRMLAAELGVQIPAELLEANAVREDEDAIDAAEAA
jgi:ParB/RepB/Spo0J family partition protein